MQHNNMKLHAKTSKFHIEHTQNGATVQHIHSIQDMTTICPKQQLGILQASKQHAQKDMARLQIITVYRLSRNNIRLQCLELSNNMLKELNMANKGMA